MPPILARTLRSAEDTFLESDLESDEEIRCMRTEAGAPSLACSLRLKMGYFVSIALFLCNVGEIPHCHLPRTLNLVRSSQRRL